MINPVVVLQYFSYTFTATVITVKLIQWLL